MQTELWYSTVTLTVELAAFYICCKMAAKYVATLTLQQSAIMNFH